MMRIVVVVLVVLLLLLGTKLNFLKIKSLKHGPGISFTS